MFTFMLLRAGRGNESWPISCRHLGVVLRSSAHTWSQQHIKITNIPENTRL